MMCQMSFATFLQVTAEYCTLVLGAAAVAPFDSKVVVPDDAAEIVTCPAPIWIRSMLVPIGNATDALVGIE